MGSLNLITYLLFITINIHRIFGFDPSFTSHGNEYEIEYSKVGKHVVTNINGAQEEIRNTDQSFNSHNTEFFTDEIKEYPHLLKSLGYNVPAKSGKIPSLADLALSNKGDTQYFYRPSLPNNYDSINKKVDFSDKNSAEINFHVSNGVNLNNKLKFPLDFYDEGFGSNEIIGLKDNPNLNGFHPKIYVPKHFKKLLAPGFYETTQDSQNILHYFPSSSKNSAEKLKLQDSSLSNSGNSNERKTSQTNVKVSERDTYHMTASPEYIFKEPDYTNYDNYMKQLSINTQREKDKMNNLVDQEEEKSQKSDKYLNTTIIDRSCDDGRTNLEVDWNGSKSDYECNADVEIPTNDRPSTMYCDPSASVVQPKTRCMNETLEYSEFIPVIGDYRPVAPQLGEYKFIPKQRWLNSLDHDAVILLYHPCAKRSALNKLRLLIMKSYERYIFTAYNLEETAPFAIVTKGCRLVMSDVVPNEVAHFLQDHGPQKVPLGKPNYRKAKYNLELIEENRRHFLMGMQY